MPFIPHTPDDVAHMLAVIGAPSIDTLFDEIPVALKAKPLDGVPPGLCEMDVARLVTERAAVDGRLLNFIGAGAYEHHIPAPVWAIASRGEFYSAYTPYQAEASQGTLQLIYEFQTMIARLTGMSIANASLYDGASAMVEEGDALTDWAHAHAALVIAVVNPTSLALLKPPGEWGARGADIAVGEGQPLGVPLSGGGPYLGFMSTRTEHVRQMPGRIVGRTLDTAGQQGFTLTLQAREQHIRRAKAISNICTNQGLLVTAATISLSLMGPQGLERTAAAAHARCRELVAALTRLPGVRLAFAGPYFHEAAPQLDTAGSAVLH